MNILVVDDEDLIRNSVVKTIKLSDILIDNIFEAKDGNKALDICKKEAIDIVLVDINMPKKNGLEFSKELKEIDENIKIGIISGYDYFDYMREAIKIGVDDYILKPTTKNDILELVNRLISKAISSKKNKKIQEIVVDVKVENEIDKIIKEYIFKKEFNLTYLADKLNLSKGYLSVLFKKKYGIPFQDYVLKIRMEKAALFLLSTNMKNYEISSEIGFESVYYFNIKFKKFFKLTPKEYKNSVIKEK